jgi:hypothetical protein
MFAQQGLAENSTQLQRLASLQQQGQETKFLKKHRLRKKTRLW